MSSEPTLKVRVKIVAVRANLALREIEMAMSVATGNEWSAPRWEILKREDGEQELTDEALRFMAEGTAHLNGIRLAEEIGRE